jgi:PAS domain S-box-containing protein
MGIAESSRQKNRNWAGASVRGRSRELVDLRRWSDDLTRIVSDWLWETNAEHRFVRVSDRAAEVIGYHPREMSGRKLVDFLHPSDGGVLLSRLAGRLPFRNVPCEMVARGGRRRSLSVSGVPLFCLETGNFQGFRGVAQDITDRSMVEDALRRRDAILRAVSHAACVLLAGSDWSTEMPGLLARLGHAAECDQVHLFETQSSPVDGPALLPKFHWIRPGTTGRCCKGGLRPTPVGEMGLAQRHPRLASGETVFVLVESIAHGWRRMLQAEGIRSMLFVPLFAGRTWWGVLRFDKSAVAADWGEPEVEAVKAAAGIVSAAIGRQQDQETIRTSETRFRVAFHTSPDAMAIVRLSDGLVVEANDNCSRLSGLDHEALIGHSLAQLPLFDNARAVARMLREISKRGEITGAETVFRQDGRAGGRTLCARRGSRRHQPASSRRDHPQALTGRRAEPCPGDDHQHRGHHRVRQPEVYAGYWISS